MNHLTLSAELMALCAKIQRMQHQAIRDGITPKEVWLGPEYHKLLGKASALQRGGNPEGKDEFIMGLRIRRSAESGVWVAVSYGIPQ